MSILVMKFGGTSVGDSKAIQRSASLAAAQAGSRQVVVVVSALAGVTNLLINGARASATDRDQVGQTTAAFLQRHKELVDGLSFSDELRNHLDQKIQANAILLYNSLFHIYRSAHTYEDYLDDILALGELTSAAVFTTLLRQAGIAVDEIDARQIICTDDHFTSASVDFQETNRRVHRFVLSTLEAGRAAVLPGFVGRTADGRTTTLGRGASDYSASIIAAALDADEIWNWTDVDGVLNADPRLVPDAEVIPQLSYDEMAEMARHGARVLHPESVAPLIEKQIPLRVRNSFRPANPGTLVYAEQPDRDEQPLAIGVVRCPESSEINIVGGQTEARLIAESLQSADVPVQAPVHTSSDNCLTVRVHPQDESQAVRVLFEALFQSTGSPAVFSAS